MTKKIILLSLIAFLFSVATVGFVWIAISVVARANPGLNLGKSGYVPEVDEIKSIDCSVDQICMMDVESGIERIVPSTCNDDTLDVAALESDGWIRCAAILKEEAI